LDFNSLDSVAFYSDGKFDVFQDTPVSGGTTYLLCWQGQRWEFKVATPNSWAYVIQG